MVAESIDIFCPIDQLGCFIACAGVIEENSDKAFVKKGPPDPVSRILETPSPSKSQ